MDLPFHFLFIPKCQLTPGRRARLMAAIDTITANEAGFIKAKAGLPKKKAVSKTALLKCYKSALKDAVRGVSEALVSSPCPQLITLYMEGMPYPLLTTWTMSGRTFPNKLLVFYFMSLSTCASVAKLLHEWATEDHAKKVAP
jgi:hypothetical protein